MISVRDLARIAAVAAMVCVALASAASAGIIFQDNFDGGASPLWNNESGSWTAIGGVYYAQTPLNLCYNSLPFNLTDFAIELDVRSVSDGGIWLRSDPAGNGVILITGGWDHSGGGLYWHTVQAFNSGMALNRSADLFQQGDNIHLRIEVQGDTYSAFFNGAATPATTLTTSEYPSGRVALYSWAAAQGFDNVVITPEPATLALLAMGGLALVTRRRGRK
ncbi:MAG: PEP-CTERM sorting domain-containing protein [Planctomycetota bacterium]|nr:PEP-CTERM sorting domain-containing protein [Planctomycetota bacterium]